MTSIDFFNYYGISATEITKLFKTVTLKHVTIKCKYFQYFLYCFAMVLLKLTVSNNIKIKKEFTVMNYKFKGNWITNNEFCNLKPRNVFHKQLEKVTLPCDEHRNRHILFRKKFCCEITKNAKIYISADDYYKLYINGNFVAQGPAPSYHFNYNYNIIDVSKYLKNGENIIAVHTLYQGLINRVWQSGDNRHGLILDLNIDGETIIKSDQSFKTAIHTAYTEMGICGYDTQFLERYDSNAKEVNFALLDFDDSTWEYAQINNYADHKLTMQKSGRLEFERVLPTAVQNYEKHIKTQNNGIIYDFGSNFVGYLCVSAQGTKGDKITIRCAQELNDDGTLRYDMRANCRYEEDWILTDGESTLDWFDYKSFRYAELIFSSEIKITEVYLNARHYPFELKANLKPEFKENNDLNKIWDLCVNTQKYGVQEVIQDCMEREKGFYLGDGCYTALTNMILTGDDSMVRKLIDDAFSTEFITDTLVTCMCCSFMQEIAEYPLILVYLIMWHYNYIGDKQYLQVNYEKVKKLLNAYSKEYEKDFLLRDIDKWCVVEWPKNFQHNYDVDILEGKVCKDAHVSLNAYYIAAIKAANKMASVLEEPIYRDETPLVKAFYNTFFDKENDLFKDGENTTHISLVGNSFVYGLGICTDETFEKNVISLLNKHGIHSLSFFCAFPVLMGLACNEHYDLLKKALLNEGAWKRILSEGGTTTFEGWGKDTKWNTSLFHLTMSYAATFMADIDLNGLFNCMSI